jgi:hypothetical protein
MILSRNLWAVVGLVGLVRGQIFPISNSTSTPAPAPVVVPQDATGSPSYGGDQNQWGCQNCPPTTVTVTCVSTTTEICTVTVTQPAHQ